MTGAYLKLEVILHIGTHKTATSSIQNFCSRHSALLQEFGISYAFDENLSARNSNFLGAYLAQGRHAEIAEFIARVCERAACSALDRVLLSGEALYAMTTFFPQFGARQGDDYWSRESRGVEALASILSNHKVSIACYLRRQDRFIESLYNQMVKQPKGFSGSVDEFLGLSECMLDYYRHLEVWADCFGDSALKVHSFERTSNIVSHFLEFPLGITNFPAKIQTGVYTNDGLSRDVLEFKRELNKREMDPVKQLFAYRAVLEVSATIGEGGGDLLTAIQRKKLVEGYSKGNTALANRWMDKGEKLFPNVIEDTPEVPAYSGLTDGRRNEIQEMYDRIMHRPSTLTEIALRKMFRGIERHIPGAKGIIQPIRRLSYKRQVLREHRSQN